MAWRKSPQALVALFDAAVVPADARIERRSMFGYPAAFLNGHLLAGLHQEDLVLKLAEADRAQMLALEQGVRWTPMPGRPMREFLALSAAVIADRARLDDWVARAVAYVGGLPPKAGKVAAKKAAAKKPAAEKAAPTKAAPTKRAAKTPAARKPAAKQPAPKKQAAKNAAPKKAAPKKAAPKKAAPKKAAPKKAAVKRPAAKKAAARTTAVERSAPKTR
jgi:outer membrane biosynthesis protein TonB